MPETETTPGFVLPLLLFAGFRTIIDRLHAELAEQGHPDVRPAHGFALQAVGLDGATASDIGRRLGISKQAAGKTTDRLTALGYVERVDDAQDGRRKLIRLTARGIDVLTRSAVIFEQLHAEWATTIGDRQLADVETALRMVVPADGFRLDVPGWFGS
ncbi:MAG TPA: MarR family transcriptional regulator [Pseudonocardiaceae bacterium]|jgi:DNA-binding MarR family transcriptional regulator|nr:MarR family transcriptional regulator [Pseudonocardiaceae bacterium]